MKTILLYGQFEIWIFLGIRKFSILRSTYKITWFFDTFSYNILRPFPKQGVLFDV